MTDTRIPVPGEVWHHKLWDDEVTIDAATKRGVMFYRANPSICVCTLAAFLDHFTPPSRPIPPAPAGRDALYWVTR
jgi:hypothetical protein